MSETQTVEKPADAIRRVAGELGLTMGAVFVPWSQSRNKGEKYPSLNWLVTLRRNGRDVLTTYYMAGSGHCPAYKRLGKDRKTVNGDRLIRYECETGRNSDYGVVDKHINPAIEDVLYSLVSDASVLDAGGFEGWAGDLGYATDSRKAEQVYKA